MKIYITCLTCLVMLYFPVFCQEKKEGTIISGFVYEKSEEGNLTPLPGAHVVCLKDLKGAVTDDLGAFSIHSIEDYPHTISVSFVGYQTDTISLNKAEELLFVLNPIILNEINLSSRKNSNAKSILKVKNVESIFAEELEKAACCNLSECFETNSTVDVSFTDAITGAKQIQMLALDGVYTQILYENMPLLRGLSASYGLSYVPGVWIESIQIAKGIGSVVNGFESLTGEINVELYKPNNADKLFWNSFVNNSGLIENNFIISTALNSSWKTALLGHHTSLGRGVDMNKDGFIDNPEMERISLLNRWEYSGFDNRNIVFGFRYLEENKVSGQMSGDDSATEIFEVLTPYVVDMKTDQAEFHSKMGFIFNKRRSVGVISSMRLHNQKILFGTSSYSAIQHSLFLNAIYQSFIGQTNKTFKFGLSYYGDRYRETLLLGVFSDDLFERFDQTLGLFSEAEIKIGEHLLSTIGLRSDYSKQWGIWYNPRLHIRYNPIETMVIRASLGKANRQANIFAENISYFFSERRLDLQSPYSELTVEKAWNYGINFLYNFEFINKETTFNADLYYTKFTDQVVVDIEETQKIKIYNLEGESFAKSIQLDFSIKPINRLELKLSQKWNETQMTYKNSANNINQNQKSVPFIPKHHTLMQVSYSSWQDKWSAHLTLQDVGSSRVPSQGSGDNFVQGFWSPPFKLFSGQATRRFQKFEWYLGVENALNFMQENPIRNIENPFDNDFDAGMIWGPVMGRLWYSGIRVSIND